jgi:hypothetical protein
VEAVGVVLALHPPGADSERHASAGDLVRGRGSVRQDRRMPECHGGDERAELQRRRACREARDRRPRIEHRPALVKARDVVIGTEERLDAVLFARVGERDPMLPGDALLAFDHQREPHGG